MKPGGNSLTISRYDNAGRFPSVTFNGSSYVNSISYAAHGAITSQTLGNTLSHQIGYNSRLQPTSISLGSVLTLSYSYGSTNNNGNVQSITITPGAGQTPFVQSFTYDELNRLKSASSRLAGKRLEIVELAKRVSARTLRGRRLK